MFLWNGFVPRRQFLVESFASQEPRRHHGTLSLEIDLAARFDVIAADATQNSRRRAADVNAERKAGRFHARGDVNRVAKDAIVRHFETDYAGDARAGVQSNAQLEMQIRKVFDRESVNRCHQVKSRISNLKIPVI